MNIPKLCKNEGCPVIVVDGKPMLLFAGEVHNSSASSLAYMAERVWPNVRDLHCNSLIVPVSWELLEPQPDVFDFSLTDGVISQARREGVKLVLLWFGLWKNGNSTYVPDWVKEDRETYFPMQTREGIQLCQSRGADRLRGKEGVSPPPLCERLAGAVSLDARHLSQRRTHREGHGAVEGFGALHRSVCSRYLSARLRSGVRGIYRP